ncbi:MAG: hypothetical protein HC907_37410 [Richelia sp. SM1_7_0]|nr:hypothetical protein [Richelia sp. SM1_7_0]
MKRENEGQWKVGSRQWYLSINNGAFKPAHWQSGTSFYYCRLPIANCLFR